MPEEVYVGRHFRGGQDHIDGDRWRRLYENRDLDDTGFLQCDECEQEVHVHAATADDPGYNEQTAAYITYADEVVICGTCLFEAFDCLEVDGERIQRIGGDESR